MGWRGSECMVTGAAEATFDGSSHISTVIKGRSKFNGFISWTRNICIKEGGHMLHAATNNFSKPSVSRLLLALL